MGFRTEEECQAFIDKYYRGEMKDEPRPCFDTKTRTWFIMRNSYIFVYGEDPERGEE